MRIAFIVRSTLFTVKGGDTIQIQQTAKHLEKLGVEVDILRTHEKIKYEDYDLFHFFNMTRPADILRHLKYCRKPIVLTPIYIDYSDYDSKQRTGLWRYLFRFANADTIEYIKTIGRFLLQKDIWPGFRYIWKGQARSIKTVLKKTNALITATQKEYRLLNHKFDKLPASYQIPLAIDPQIFFESEDVRRDPDLVLCVARIEGIKNQLNLVKAINNTKYSLLLIGNVAPNHKKYADECRKIAGQNVIFKTHISQKELKQYYQTATVHVLPSWFENFGLSTIEAAAMGCQVVVSHKAFITEFLQDEAFYCDPSDPSSIRKAIDEAAGNIQPSRLKKRILNNLTWDKIAEQTLTAYKEITV